MRFPTEPAVDPEIAEAIDSLPDGEFEAMPGLNPEQTLRFFSLARKVYRRTCEQATGLHHLPMGPILVVANQAGQFPLDAISIAIASLLYASPPRLLRLLRPGSSRFPVPAALTEAGITPVTEVAGSTLLREGHALLSFPEGLLTPSKIARDRNRLLPFALEPFRLAIQHRATLVPVAVQAIVPLLGTVNFFPLPSRLKITVGEPIAALGDERPEGLAASLQARVQRLLHGGPPLLERG
ncbi:MAG: hypothetical protein RMJ98_12705 [Myxococcales bacterium]|nr:hypothetical protein [Polyangiaceae bacterium]MDW8250147.1 hypothetical protein [Myxococcales bacterium]